MIQHSKAIEVATVMGLSCQLRILLVWGPACERIWGLLTYHPAVATMVTTSQCIGSWQNAHYEGS